MTADAQTNDSSRSRDRRFSVSSNRGAAHHRLRYVEAGGASVDIEECSFCQSNPELDWNAEIRNLGAQPLQETEDESDGRPKKY